MNEVKWGLIGCGDIARKRVATGLSSANHSALVAVSRARSDLAAEFAREFGVGKHYSDWRQMVEDSEVNAVYIATPVYLHIEQALAAAKAGKHILCEKPMALDVTECDVMIAACREHGVRLGVAYYRHFYPAVQRIKEIIQSGEIGTPIVAQVNAFERFNPSPGADRSWLVDRKKAGGGPMMDFGCHRIEILINVFGKLQSARALTTNALFPRDVEDTAVALLGFENGMQAVVSISHAAREPLDTLDIFGSEGTIRIPVLNQGVLHIKSSQGERAEELPPAANLHLPMIQDFVDAVLDQRDPRVDGHTGRAVAEVISEIYRRSAVES